MSQGISHDVFETGSIPLADLKPALKLQGTEVKFGDILIIRSGYLHSYNSKSKEELTQLSKRIPPGLLGVEQSQEMLQWIWENFSAIAGDQPSFECWRKCSSMIKISFL